MTVSPDPMIVTMQTIFPQNQQSSLALKSVVFNSSHQKILKLGQYLDIDIIQ